MTEDSALPDGTKTRVVVAEDEVLIRGAIGRIRQLGRGTVIGGHMGRFPAVVLDNAVHYLDRLREAVVSIRTNALGPQANERIAAISIEACVAPQVGPAATSPSPRVALRRRSTTPARRLPNAAPGERGAQRPHGDGRRRGQ